MVTFDALQSLALSLPEVTEAPHFEKTSFRVTKKIFATWAPSENCATVKLSEKDQDLFCLAGAGAIYPVPN